MMGFGHHRCDRTFPELLAAYADGELDAAARARVEAWLAERPEARADLDTQRRLSSRNKQLWRESAAPAPGEASWARLLHRIQGAMNAPNRPSAALPRRHWLGRTAAVVAVAAAVLVGVVILRPTGGPPTGDADEPAWAVATDADIEIVSLQEADADRLVVGEPPLQGPVQLAAVTDVELMKVEKDTDGMMPQVQMNAGPNAPMIVAPIAAK